MSPAAQRFRRIAFLMAVILVVGWLVSIRCFNSYRDAFGQPIGPDFLQFYTGATLLLQDQGANLYDFSKHIAVESAVLHSAQEYLHPYIYPPLFAWFLQPLAILDYRVAFAIWTLGGLLILWGVMRWLSLSFFLALSWFPVFAALSYGQNSFLSLGVIALLTGSYLRGDRPFLTGCMAGMLLYKPQLFLALFPGMILLGEWRVVGGMILSGVFVTALSWSILPQETIDFAFFAIHKIPLLVGAPGFPVTQFFDLKGFFLLLLPRVSSLWISLLSAMVVLYFIIVFWRSTRFLKEEDREWRMMSVILLMPWMNLYYLVYDWTIYLIVSGMLRRRCGESERRWLDRVVLGLWITGWISVPIATWMKEHLGFAIQIAPLVLAYFTMQFFRSVINRNAFGTTDSR